MTTTDKSKTTAAPASDDTDPADAFKRVTVEPDVDFMRDAPPPKSKSDKKKKGAPRAPVVERIAREAPPEDDEGMDPMDAAEEIIGLMDQLFAAATMIRGYDKIMIKLPDGSSSSLLAMAAPDDAAKARTKKAVARMLKTAGASMSPGMGLAFTAFGCYGAPIIAMEVARKATKKGG